MYSLFLVLCVAVCSGAAHSLGELPSLVNIPWRKSLLSCECSDSTLDCSERGKSALNADDVACDTPIRAVNLFDNTLLNFPDGLESAVIVNASRNNLTQFPRSEQLNDNVTFLDLSENSITNVGSNIRDLISLQTLKLGMNSLNNLEHLPQPCSLMFIEVCNNKLTALPSSLMLCTNLQSIDASNNNITTLHEDSLNFTQLTSLDISWNPVAPFSRNIFSSLRVLKELRLDGVGLSSIPEGLFDNLERLEYLSLDGNLLATVNGNSFSALGNLVYLSISRNALHTFPGQSFRNSSSLEVLHLAENELTSLPSASFSMFPRLKLVNISSNNFSFLPDDVFSGVNNLERVFMRNGGSPRLIPSRIFSNLRNLKFVALPYLDFQSEFLLSISHIPALQCHSCGLTSLPARGFEILPQTQALSLDYNTIFSISVNALEGLTHLTYLSLGGNNITALPVPMFSPVRELTRLHLWDNKLTTLPEGIFSGLNQLTGLTLIGNELTVLPESIFNETYSLQRLDLSQNRLETLPRNLFRNLIELWELNLANNLLTSIPAYDDTCVSLRAVSLEQNNFRTLDRELLNPWLFSGSNERFVNLAHNSSKIAPHSVDWLLENNEVKHTELNGNSTCTSVRSEKTLLRYCVNVTIASGMRYYLMP